MLVRSANVNVMMKAASAAGRSLTRDFNEVEHLQVTRKGPGDFVSAADRQAERLIYETLIKARPDYGFLMEEEGEIDSPSGDRFIIDPLDGTTNFLHGLPHFAVSIAAEEQGVVTAAVVYDPIKDEMFWADRGKGSYLGSRRLHVSKRRQLPEAVIATGIPFLDRHNDDQGHQNYLQQLARVMGATAGVRRWGAAALDLCYVAAGRYDGFWERGLSPWDTAAGALIAREAGANITNLQGANWHYDDVDLISSNYEIHPELLNLVTGPRKIERG